MTLLLISLISCVAAARSQCTVHSFCEASDATGTSTNSSTLPRPSYLPSCLFLCSQSDSCFATMHDPVTDTCELHEESHGSDCFTLHPDPGKTVWYRKPGDRACLKGIDFSQESTCDANPLGTSANPGLEWSEKPWALVYGPITAIRVWTNPAANNPAVNWIQSVQVRYGDRWAPVHPEGILPDQLTAEYLLQDGETFTRISAFSGYSIGSLAFETNARAFPAVGDTLGPTFNEHISLKDTLYFSGKGYSDGGRLRVTQLLAHRATCG